jgi:hypothetical protein
MHSNPVALYFSDFVTYIKVEKCQNEQIDKTTHCYVQIDAT